MPAAPGTRLGPYEIVRPIGAGGMGEVYEARSIAALNHPNICALHDIGGAGGHGFLVMERLEDGVRPG